MDSKDRSPRMGRKKWLIYPAFQIRLMVVQGLILVGAFLLAALEVHQAFDHLRNLGTQVHLPEGHPYYQFLRIQARELTGRLWIAAFGGAVISVFASLLLSHRVAGPIVRLVGYFRQIRIEKKIIQDLRFRKGDYFSDLPEQINGALDELCRDPLKGSGKKDSGGGNEKSEKNVA